MNKGALTLGAFSMVQPVLAILSGSFLALTMPTKSEATIVSVVAKATVNVSLTARLSVVACDDSEIMISFMSQVPPHAAFIALGRPSLS